MSSKLRFKNKTYGYGWVPVSWEGWLVTWLYAAIVIILTTTLDENSSRREVFFMGVLPIVLLTITLLRIAYKKGEKPEWRRGEKTEKWKSKEQN